MKRIHCEIRGKVQSCGFRDYCWKCTRKTGVTGWAANDMADIHHVVVEVQGEEGQLEQFFSLLLKGNGSFRIDSIGKTEIPIDFSEKIFQARYRKE